MTKATKEQKNFAFQIKSFDDETGTVRGYLSTFNNIDEQGDRVRPGAFKRTLQSKYQYKKAHNKTYLMPLLWQHSAETPIGGYTEAKEDSVGLYVEFQIDMDVQRGKEAYSGLKKGYLFQQSIGYEPIQAEYVKEDDGTMVRDLTEIRLWEGSVVTFPANELAVVTGVKSMEQKTICGNTSGKIGPRDEAWDGSKAEGQIWDVAYDEDTSKIDTALAKKYFMVVDGDPQKKGSYSYPFWFVGDDPHICVGAVKAIAGAIQGSRGASAPDGLKAKVETLYSRINKLYPDSPELTPPWKDDDGKGNSMNRRQRKTLLEHYNEEMACDLLEDLQDVYICSLIKAIFDAFTIGDQPEADVSQALDDFKSLMLSKFVAQAVDCDLSQYLENQGYQYTPGLSTMLNGSDDGSSPYYGYMSRSTRMDRKAGRSISASNQAVIDDHVKAVKAMAKQAKTDMQSHVDSIHDAVDGMSGNGKSLSTSAFKAGRSLSATNADKLHDMADKAMNIVQDHAKALNKAANGLSSAMSGSNSEEYGDSGEEDQDEQIEKSLSDALMEIKALAS